MHGEFFQLDKTLTRIDIVFVVDVELVWMFRESSVVEQVFQEKLGRNLVLHNLGAAFAVAAVVHIEHGLCLLVQVGGSRDRILTEASKAVPQIFANVQVANYRHKLDDFHLVDVKDEQSVRFEFSFDLVNHRNKVNRSFHVEALLKSQVDVYKTFPAVVCFIQYHCQPLVRVFRVDFTKKISKLDRFHIIVHSSFPVDFEHRDT